MWMINCDPKYYLDIRCLVCILSRTVFWCSNVNHWQNTDMVSWDCVLIDKSIVWIRQIYCLNQLLLIQCNHVALKNLEAQEQPNVKSWFISLQHEGWYQNWWKHFIHIRNLELKSKLYPLKYMPYSIVFFQEPYRTPPYFLIWHM